MSDGFDRCQHPGCSRRLMRHTGYTLCLLHRGRPSQAGRRFKTKEARERDKAREQRRRASAGVAWEGV